MQKYNVDCIDIFFFNKLNKTCLRNLQVNLRTHSWFNYEIEKKYIINLFFYDLEIDEIFVFIFLDKNL